MAKYSKENIDEAIDSALATVGLESLKQEQSKAIHALQARREGCVRRSSDRLWKDVLFRSASPAALPCRLRRSAGPFKDRSTLHTLHNIVIIYRAPLCYTYAWVSSAFMASV